MRKQRGKRWQNGVDICGVARGEKAVGEGVRLEVEALAEWERWVVYGALEVMVLRDV